MATRVLFSKIPLFLCFYQRLDLYYILGITTTIANVLNSIWWWPTLLQFVSHCESQGMTLQEVVVNIQNKDLGRKSHTYTETSRVTSKEGLMLFITEFLGGFGGGFLTGFLRHRLLTHKLVYQFLRLGCWTVYKTPFQFRLHHYNLRLHVLSKIPSADHSDARLAKYTYNSPKSIMKTLNPPWPVPGSSHTIKFTVLTSWLQMSRSPIRLID
jgi:hypothetical protein